MFSSSKNIERLRELFEELKEYFVLQKRYVMLDIVEKITILLCKLILGIILFMLGIIVILYFSVAFTIFMANIVGGMLPSCVITALLFSLLALIVYAKRKAWIVVPILNFIAHLFIDKNKEDDDQ